MRSKELPHSQIYDSKYSTVQYYNASLEDLYESIKEKKQIDKLRRKELEKARRREFEKDQTGIYRVVSKIWRHTVGKFGEEWIFLAVLGMIVAILSYTIDKGVGMCTSVRGMLYSELADRYFTKWVAWICVPVILILWDTGITNLIGLDKSIGSGIPQIKCCLRGILLDEFLTFRVLVAKWWGVTATLGAGMPLGKEGPLIHMASIIVTKMSKALSSFRSIYLNENKKIEMIAAAWAVGVATTFNAPIGGVLFSVEISTAYFAVRNYWRGFFAAVWAATTYRLLYVWIDGLDTIRVVFTTSFITDFPYDPLELISFAILGVICGFLGSFYMFCKKSFNAWMGGNKYVNRIKKFNRYIYPCFIVMLVSTVTWPPGIGQFHATDISPKLQVEQLFSNFTWTKENHTVAEYDVLSHWTTKWSGVFTSLVVFFWYQFVFSIIASTMPVPAGSFIPVFRAGAALGRIGGELMHIWWPQGVRYKGKITPIMPGAYATVGAVAFTGAVTHCMSVSVVMFEMTSQISHVIPVLIANLIANGIARFFTPSLYDLAIIAKKMPYLPDILPNKSGIYSVNVEDFMTKHIKYVYLGMTYGELKANLKDNKTIRMFPLVDNNRNMVLIGAVCRYELIRLIDMQIGWNRRTDILPNAILERNKYDQNGTGGDHDNDETENEDSSSGREEETKSLNIPQSPSCSKEDEMEKQKDKKLSVKEKIFAKYDMGKKKTLRCLVPLKHTGTKRKKKEQHEGQSKPSVIRICDLTIKEQMVWEAEQLAQIVDFTKCHVDPAPFQLVEGTSLIKVHSLFSLMALNVAYITSIGKLVGVVTLTDLRKAIDDTNHGRLPKQNPSDDNDSDARKPLLPK